MPISKADKRLDNICKTIAIVVILAILIFGYMGYRHYRNGCDEYQRNLKWGVGDVVELKVGGCGQVIIRRNYPTTHPYLIRIRGEDGFDQRWMEEFEISP